MTCVAAAFVVLLCIAAESVPAAAQDVAPPGTAATVTTFAGDVGDGIRDRGLAVYDRMEDRLGEILAAIPMFALAVVVFVLFVAAARFVADRSGLIARLGRNPFQRQILTQTLRIAIIVVGLVLALEIVNATSLIGAVLGAAGMTGIVLGFALRETIENYVAGLLLSLRQPFAPNDHLLVLGFEGHVIRLTSRATVLMTLDGNHVRIPNADVFKSPLVNYTRNPERRFDFTVGVGTDVDLAGARRLAIETLADTPGVLADPEPDAWIETLGDSNVELAVLGWIDQRRHSLPKVRGEAIRRVKAAFEAADFDLPEPIYRLKLTGDAAAVPETNAAGPAPGDTPPPAADDGPEPDIARDTHLDREVAQERAEMPENDLLDPAAARE